MILVDTSVWIDHLRNNNKTLALLLEKNQVSIHTLIIGELACGNLINRKQLLALLNKLEHTVEASFNESIYLIENNQLMGKGVGFIDIQLLASVLITKGAILWTFDKRLESLAKQFNVNWVEGSPDRTH